MCYSVTQRYNSTGQGRETLAASILHTQLSRQQAGSWPSVADWLPLPLLRLSLPHLGPVAASSVCF